MLSFLLAELQGALQAISSAMHLQLRLQITLGPL